MVMPEYMDGLTIDDLPNEGLQYLAQVAGMETAKKVLTHCAGMRFDIPIRPCRKAAKRYIEIHYNGNNARQLARTLGMSERFVYQVLSEKSEIRADIH